jgi:formylglycine-generating enzyme required for sulfatase activity
MTAEIKNRNPYPGPRPFEREEQRLFFGREREARELRSLITAHRAVLLYAQSGAGKTSLLNAGLIPLLTKQGFEVLPVARVRGFEPEDIDLKGIPNIYVFNTLVGWAGDNVGPRSLVSTSIVTFLEEREHLMDEQGLPLPRVAIFDQFEELFTSYPGRWKEREDFFRQVAETLEADPLLRVLFVIREDYLASLDSYVDLLPERLRTRYRLRRLRADAACQAVERPLRDTEYSFAEGVASSLVQQLLNIRVTGTTGEVIETIGEYVEPVQLQVVCQSLWLNLPREVTVITSDHLQEFGNVQEALRNFYERAVETAKRETGVNESDLRGWFNDKLITPAGTRGTVFQGKEQTEGIPNSAVDVLEAQHIIRAEMRAGARWYELTHDRLIEPISKSNEEFERSEAQRRAKAQARARIARCLRRIAAALIAICIVMLAVIIMIYLSVFPQSLTVTFVDGSVTKHPDKARYKDGETVILEAVPTDGYSFVNWSGDLSDSNNPAVLVMDADKSVTATFVETYSLTVTSVHGSVVIDPNKARYSRSAKVTLKAESNAGYSFTNWSGDLDDSNNPDTLVMNGDKSVTANFDLMTYSLTTDANNGSVTKDPEKASYNYGETVVLEAVPIDGYSFVNWSGDLSDSTNPAALVMDEDKSVTPNFVLTTDLLKRYMLNATAVDGSVTKTPDKASYNDGETVILEAVANTGYSFTNWSGNLSGSNNRAALIMDADKSVTANFVALEAGDEVTNSIGMKLVYIPDGSFMMGSGDSAAQLSREYRRSESQFRDEFPQHKVRISEGFWMGQTEVTQGQYLSVMNAKPFSGLSYVKESVSNPAVNVSWDDAAAFCRKLSELEKNKGKTYRLPTEAEWEYACRAGTTTQYSFGDSYSSLCEYAWFESNAFNVGQKYAHPAGRKKPNPWGLYDMHGNVWEWCSDWYDENYYSNGPSVDPKGPLTGTYRCLRGGSWYSHMSRLRCSHREHRLAAPKLGSSEPSGLFGFRVVRQAKTTYSLTVKAVGGTVTKNPDKAGYTHGETVVLEAVANTGYSFKKWSGDLSSSNNRAALVMDADKSVTANFAQMTDSLKVYSLTVTSVQGSVVIDPNNNMYSSGATVTLTAIPNVGYSFLNWSGDLSGSTNPATLDMYTDKSVSANFVPNSVVTPPGFYIHNGCVKFEDREDVISKGPITLVRVCHGDYIYGIQLRYSSQVGSFFGLETRKYGLQVTEWPVPPGEQIVRVEGQIAKYGSGFLYVSRLQFITDKGIRSPWFGGKSGTPFVAADRNGLPLRTISGWANLRQHPSLKRAITSMTFDFGD